MLQIAPECKVLEAELSRVAEYHSRECARWEERVHRHFADQPDYYEGANGYSLRQASFHRSLQDRCTELWQVVRDVMGEHPRYCYDSLASSEPSESLASPTLADTVSTHNGLVDGYVGVEL